MTKKTKKEMVIPQKTSEVITFMDCRGFTLDRLVIKEPSAFNSSVLIEKYKVTVEVVEEPVEVYHERLEQLWINCNNYHNYDSLMSKAKRYNYVFKGEFGENLRRK